MALPPNYLFVNPKDGRLVSRSYLQVPGGTSADPGISFIDSADSGFSCDASGVVSIISDGVQGVTVSSSAVNLISPVSLTGALSFPLGTAAAPSLYPGTDTNTGLWSPAADTLAWSTGGSERARIDSSGNISFNGTNTTTSNTPGQIYKFFGGSGNIVLPFESSATEKNAQFEYRRTGRSGNARASQISIGENSSNEGSVVVLSSAANADVSGGVVLANGATAWSAFSDVRLKNIIGHFDSALADVSALEAFRFTWKDDASETTRVGLSAQSVQSVLPEAVSSGKLINAPADDNTKYLSVRYTEVIPLLVAALQESKERIEALEAKVEALESA